MNPVALSLIAIPFIHLLAVALPIARTDIREHRIPNKLILPVAPTAIVFAILATLASGEPMRLVASLVIALILFVIGVRLNGNLGMGDTKMITIMAVMLSWLNPFAMLGVLGLAFVCVYLLITVPAIRRVLMPNSYSLPLAPYLLGSFVIVSALCFIGVA